MADICLLVEGAYPYIAGGVSSWIQSLISNLPEFSFCVLHIGARPDPTRKMLYKLPENVIEFREVFLSDIDHIKAFSVRRTRKPDKESWQQFMDLHQALMLGGLGQVQQFFGALQGPGYAGLRGRDIFSERASWDALTQLYTQHASEQSFIDFFWTFRLTYLPFFSILEAELPEAHIYHAVSTGFGGLLGALAQIRKGRPFFVTEHGIYTREREIEIMQSAWLQPSDQSVTHQRMGFFQKWWFNLFRFMERVSYEAAENIISVAGVNQDYQRRHGADPRKLRLIPNGINTAQLASVQKERDPDRYRVGFVGRIVPIKDVKTLIRALKIACQVIPNLEAWLIGPTDEDLSYFKDCQRLVEMLNLENIVRFTGPTDVRTIYGKLDVMLLTSLSEGQPLVILEGNCAGLPVISTDVGSCRELLTGISLEDQALGISGLITPVSSPQEIAEALVYLWKHPDLREQMGRAGQQRVQRYYRQEQLYDSYREIYQKALRQKVEC